jgi:hypothetical protein
MLVDEHDVYAASEEQELRDAWTKHTQDDNDSTNYLSVTSYNDTIELLDDSHTHHLDGADLNYIWDAGQAPKQGAWDTKCAAGFSFTPFSGGAVCRHHRVVMHKDIINMLVDKGILTGSKI